MKEMTRRSIALGTGLAVLCAALAAAEVPRKAPELAIQFVNGQQLLLSQFRGKVVLLAFVHTTCPHCQQDSQLFERLSKEYGPRGFQPIDVAFNDNAAQLVPDFVRQLNLTFPVGFAGRDTVVDYLQLSYVKPYFVPQMVLIDRKGVIREQHGGEDDFFKNLEPNLRTSIEGLLKEPASSAQRSRTTSGSASAAKPKPVAKATKPQS